MDLKLLETQKNTEIQLLNDKINHLNSQTNEFNQ